MATLITKNSSTASSVPTNAQLVQGELAVNVTDKRLYTENASGTVVELGTNPGSAVTHTAGTAGAPAITTTGDTNTGIFFPAADTVAASTGGTERLRLDSSGNLGLGVTPSAWGSNWRVVDQLIVGSMAASTAGVGDYGPVFNAYNDNTNWRYKYTGGAAMRYRLNESGHAWFTAPSGTAGNAISFTQAMTLDASGNLGVGTTSPTAGFRLDVQATTARQRIESTTGTNEVHQRYINTGGTFFVGLDASTGGGFGAAYGAALWHTGNYPMLFGTNNTERARITSGGYLLVGTTSGIVAQTGVTSTHNISTNVDTGYGLTVSNTSGGAFGLGIKYTAHSPNNAGNSFVWCSDGGGTQRASIYSNGGLANYSGNNVNLSDRREKTNFAPAKDYLDTICAIPVQTFNYIDQSEDDPGTTLGVVAQDVQAVAPELVMESNWGTKEDPKMRLSIYQTDLQYALMKALQELNAKVESLTTELNALKGT